MKRIETFIYNLELYSDVSQSIYSIYLEWKGLRQFFEDTFVWYLRFFWIYSIYLEWKGLRHRLRLRTSCVPCRSPLSILYTLNEKDWDRFIYVCGVESQRHVIFLSILYTLNEKDWDYVFFWILFAGYCWYPNLFYIPWMKRIETFS